MINRVNKPQSIYDMMGGEEPLKSLVETFYDIVETDPAGELVRVLHLRGNSIAHTRLAQFDFLSGFWVALDTMSKKMATRITVKYMSMCQEVRMK